MGGANPNWQAFIDDLPWFLERHETADVGKTRPPGAWQASESDFDVQFPPLAKLLRSAEVTPVVVGATSYQLFTWHVGEQSRAWLCRAPSAKAPIDIYTNHALLLRSFGGIVERANEPSGCWLLNQNEVLTEKEASYDASFIEHYSWAFEERPGKVPILLHDYYSIAREANGNDTICHRRDGSVLLFAPDHSFEHVTPLAGCPQNTLYTLDGAAIFSEWVNLIASQWEQSLTSDA